MREIKFNFYNTSNKIYTKWEESNAGMLMSTFYTHDHLVFLQYTGLKDKNGKRVYDGDSFTAKHRSGHEYKGYIQKGLSFEFVIKNYSKDFVDGEGFKETDFTFDINSFVQYFPVDDFEVIGNIYENLELLEGDANV